MLRCFDIVEPAGVNGSDDLQCSRWKYILRYLDTLASIFVSEIFAFQVLFDSNLNL